MNNPEKPSIKEVINYHLTSSLVRIASFTEYLATSLNKPEEKKEEASSSSSLPLDPPDEKP